MHHSSIGSSSARFHRVTVIATPHLMPGVRTTLRMPATLRSQYPDEPRHASCLAGSTESRLISAYLRPAATSSCTFSGVHSVPLVATVRCMPRSAA